MQKDFPVIIMEPLRGGRLVNLLPWSQQKNCSSADKEGRTPAELALKWLYNQPEVTCVLSGMNSMEMVEQNLKTASESHVGCLTASDAALIEQVKEETKSMSNTAVPDVGIVCRVRGEWIFREHSAVIMRCIRKGKNQDGKIIYSVRHSGKTPQALPVCRLRKMRKTLPAAY